MREAFTLYVGQCGAKSVARTLNQRGYRTRAGALWLKNLVMLLLGEKVLTGTVWWGRRKGNMLRPKEEWIALKVEPIIDAETWALAQKLRSEREPKRTPGRAPSQPKLLKGLAWCGKCGASYQYETSGKAVINGHYSYGYYNCRNLLRVGKEACSGFRISTETLDGAVLGAIARIVCTEDRAGMASRRSWPHEGGLEAWRTLVRSEEIGRAYALRLIERIDVHGERIIVMPKSCGRKEPESSHMP